jgi:hypothetical protein
MAVLIATMLMIGVPVALAISMPASAPDRNSASRSTF